ncbi:MAG TPA: helix-turn-helix domain-containing protein [Anaerolineae bacterium]|nr:helix-turn-helix domain-containing protein [Anaerolineae bacterium]
MRGKTPIQENVVYSREEAAQALGVSLSTLKRLISTGQLAASQPSGMRRVFIQGSSILAMLDTTRVENGHYAS